MEDEFHRRLHLAEDHFHRRMQSSGRRETSTASSNSSTTTNNNINNVNSNSINSINSSNNNIGNSTQQQVQLPLAGGGSFWRTDSNNNYSQGPSFSSMSMKSPTSSSGRLGAVLQLHSENTATPVAGAPAPAGSPILNGGNVAVSSTNYNATNSDSSPVLTAIEPRSVSCAV